MKKGLAIFIALVLALGLCATAALAAGGHHGAGSASTGCAGRGWNYVDADGDGVCDHLGTGCAGTGCTGQGWNYVDADGDGVCDHLGTGGHWGHSRGGCRN